MTLGLPKLNNFLTDKEQFILQHLAADWSRLRYYRAKLLSFYFLNFRLATNEITLAF